MSDSVQTPRPQPTRVPRPWDSPDKNTGVGCHFLLQCIKVKSESEVAQLCPTLSDPMDCSPPGSSIHGIFQARILEWGAIALGLLIHRKHLGNACKSPKLLDKLVIPAGPHSKTFCQLQLNRDSVYLYCVYMYMCLYAYI